MWMKHFCTRTVSLQRWRESRVHVVLWTVSYSSAAFGRTLSAAACTNFRFSKIREIIRDINGGMVRCGGRVIVGVQRKFQKPYKRKRSNCEVMTSQSKLRRQNLRLRAKIHGSANKSTTRLRGPRCSLRFLLYRRFAVKQAWICFTS